MIGKIVALGISASLLAGCSPVLGETSHSEWRPIPDNEFREVPSVGIIVDTMPTESPVTRYKAPTSLVKPKVVSKYTKPKTVEKTRYNLSVEEGRKLAKAYVRSRVSAASYTCLVNLWNKESGWNYRDLNRSSGAYGIPQALPGSKMKSAGADWKTNPITQVKWGLGYVKGRYGSACAAWRFWLSHRWY